MPRSVGDVDLNIQISQSRDRVISVLRERLENEDVPNYVLENGLVFRVNHKQKRQLYVPTPINIVNYQCNNNNPDYFQLSEEDIRIVINSLDQHKVNSPDEIPTLFYKNQMKYPDSWKTSFITPIHKSGDNANIENYRPISVLPAIAKIFDKLLYNHIQVKTANLLSNQQHGFTTGKSTLTNLLEYTDYIANNITNSCQIDVIFMDLAKAFDKVDQNILLHKLSTLPLDPCLIALLQSYLTGRKQYISIRGELSHCISPNSSVPNSFALFINDLPPLIKTRILLFADDLEIFLKITSHQDCRLPGQPNI